MPQINLSIERTPHDLGNQVAIEEIRLSSQAVFLLKDKQALSKEYDGIIDTGAPLSVIPHYIWSQVYTDVRTSHLLSGVVSKKECVLYCPIGSVLMQFVDSKGQRSQPLAFWAYLLPKGFQSPLIFGYHFCLDKFKLVSDIPNGQAYLEFSKPRSSK